MLLSYFVDDLDLSFVYCLAEFGGRCQTQLLQLSSVVM